MTAGRNKDGAKRNVLEWLKEPGILRIAEYQRSYCWPESFIINFVKTILAAFDDKSAHFGPADLGLIVLETDRKNGNTIENIADGQQRLMTFALFAVAVLGKDEFTEYSRISYLLGKKSFRPCDSLSENKRVFTDLETLMNAEEAYGIINKVLDRQPFRKKEIGENLRKVTFGLLEIPVNVEHATVDRCIERLFEAFNTTGKPLNGGQILKARHYGAIAVPDQLKNLEEYWHTKSEYTTELTEVSTTSPALLSNDEFVDSPNQNAWYLPGRGFVQAVQGILLEQDRWWYALNQQGQERMDPFDRMEGIEQTHANWPGASGNIDLVLQNYDWKADAPLVFEKGWGFFALTSRLKRLFSDLVRGLESTRQQINNQPEGKKELSLPESNIVTQAFFHGVCDAIETMRLVQQRIEVLKVEASKNNESDLEPYKSRLINALGRYDTNTDAELKEIDKMLVETTNINYWLGLQANGLKGQDSSGCMITVVFSILLCWADRFEKNCWDSGQGDDLSRGDSREPIDSVSIAGTLRQLALWLFLAARFDYRCRYSKVLARLHIKDAIAAAHFSHDLDNAWWRFMKQVRQDGEVQNFFLGLREFFSEHEQNIHSDRPQALVSLINAYLD